MRLLLDEHGFEWEPAWELVVRSMGYTNHTLLPEALETWPLALLAELLPRHVEIIYEINARFLAEVRARRPGDEALAARVSLFAESGGRSVRMAHLATVGSHAVNGVAALHTDLLKSSVLRDFNDLWPRRFSNVTNGVTPRRFLALANPGLRDLVTSVVGQDWIGDLARLRALEPYADDAGFRRRWREVRRDNKQRLAAQVLRTTGVAIEPDWMYDVQVKRIHEYKRQHLNALHVVDLYRRLKRESGRDVPPRVFLFGGKAAPGYFMAKRIIKLITSLADTINADPAVNGRLRVVYLPNFNVQSAQAVYAAADLSEQVSTAGKEASGTGNMKFMMNGALTIGTLDGANVEIREEAGAENFFLFGLTVAEVERLRRTGYRPRDVVESSPRLRACLELVADGTFSHGDREVFRPLVENLLGSDPFLVLADFESYVACQERVAEAWQDAERWTRMSILNTARSGKFSSDRAVREYCDGIWDVARTPVAIT
jgi:starch phosphorylase